MQTVLQRQASAPDLTHGPQKFAPLNTANYSSSTISIAAAAGNQTMQRWLALGVIQAKLSVSLPTDPDEREADRVAEHVMSAAAGPPEHSKCNACAVGSICSTCADERIQTQRQPGSGSPVSTTPNIEALRGGGGQPLASSVRNFFEPRFGRDFGAVRVHTDGPAAETARAIQARAYTYGSNIAFGTGAYEPESRDGQKLLAHELVHVVQQSEDRTATAVQRDFDERAAGMTSPRAPLGVAATRPADPADSPAPTAAPVETIEFEGQRLSTDSALMRAVLWPVFMNDGPMGLRNFVHRFGENIEADRRQRESLRGDIARDERLGRDPAFTDPLFPFVSWCNYLGRTILEEFNCDSIGELPAHRIDWTRPDGGLLLLATSTPEEAATDEGEQLLMAMTDRFRAARK